LDDLYIAVDVSIRAIVAANPRISMEEIAKVNINNLNAYRRLKKIELYIKA